MRSVPDLTRAHLTKAQMRREPRRTGVVEPVAPAGIASHGTSKKFIEPLLPGQLARRPALAQPTGPIRLRGLEAPAFKRVACGVWSGAHPVGGGRGLWWIPQPLPPPPERREYAQAAILLVTDVGGGCQ